MPKEDYLIKFLEKLGRVVAVMLGLREKEQVEDAIRLADETFKEVLTYDLNAIKNMSLHDFDVFVRKLGYTSTYIEALAKLTDETALCYAETGDKPTMRIFSEKALLLYCLLSEKDKTFSFEREMIIAELKQQLSD